MGEYIDHLGQTLLCSPHRSALISTDAQKGTCGYVLLGEADAILTWFVLLVRAGGRRMGIAPEEDVDMQVQPKDGDTPEQRTGADAQARHTHRYHSGSSEPRSTQTSQGLLLQQPPQLQPQPHQGQQLADMTRLPTQASVGGPSRPLGQQSSQFPVFAPPGLGINVAAATASHQPRQDVASSSARVDALKRGRDDGTADTDGTANTQ